MSIKPCRLSISIILLYTLISLRLSVFHWDNTSFFKILHIRIEITEKATIKVRVAVILTVILVNLDLLCIVYAPFHNSL